MPNNSIDVSMIRQFSDRFHLTAEQTKSKLADSVNMIAMQADNYSYDSLGGVESEIVSSRNQPITFADVDVRRRKLARKRHAITIPIDSYDLKGALIDPTSPYTGRMVAEFGRVKDRTIVEACFANVKTGRDFENEVTFDEDGGMTVDATAGLTYEKLLEIRDNFLSMDVNEKDITLAVSNQEFSRLMQENKLTSRDFITTHPIEGGMMTRVMNMRLVIFGASVEKPILNVSGGMRDCIAIAITPETSGILVGISKDVDIKIQERPDLTNTTQINGTVVLGALRTEGTLIQKVQTTPVL